jgi:hypothetical protein
LWLRHNSAKKVVVVLAYFDQFGGLTGSVVEYVRDVEMIHCMLRSRKLGKVFFEMGDDSLVEVQYHAKLVVVPVLRQVVDDRTHDLDVDILATYHMVSVSASSPEVIYIVDASQEVVDLLQDLRRQVREHSHECWSC